LNNDDVLWRALLAQARAERQLKKGNAALGVAKAAVLAVRRMAAVSLDRPTQTVPRDSTSAYATLAVIQAEAGDANGAFDTIEEMRTHALRMWLAANEGQITREMTADERAEERSLTAEVRGLLAKRERIAGLPKVEKADVERLDASIVEAIGRRTAWRDRVLTRLPALKAWRGLMAPATSADLDSLLTDTGQLLLTFVVDEHDLVILTARRAVPGEAVTLTAQVVPVDRQSLGERIVQSLDAAPLHDSSKWRAASDELFKLLPPEIVTTLGSATTIYVVPDDLLWRVPFEALPTAAGYLSDRATLTYLPSVTAVVRSPQIEKVTAARPIALVSAPELPSTLVERLTATAPTWMLRKPEPAASETERIAAVFREDAAAEFAGTLLTGAAATRPAVGEAMAAAAAVHIAAPFRLNSASPLFSPVLLAAEQTGVSSQASSDETVLDVREVFNLTTAASVVTFSDAAALSMRDSAAALPPLYWGWHAAGAQAVLVRRWGGVEENSVALLEAFYEQLKNGRTPTAALHAARASIRSQKGGHPPGAWAGWILLSSLSGSGANGATPR
jgi:CHAT domain-containing protein